MAVVLGEEDGLGDGVAVGEYLSADPLLECPDDGPNLGGIDDSTVELLRLVDELVI